MKKKIVKIVSVALASAIALGTLAFGGWLFCTTPKNVELTVDEAQNEQYAFGDFSLAINKQSGTFSVKQNGKVFLADAVSEYKLDNKIVSSADYTDFRVQTSGEALSLQMKRNGLPTVVQTFTFPSGKPYFLTELTLSSAEKIRTDYIAPLVLENGGIANSGEKWSCFLEVPYDNDGWVQFETKTLNQSGKAYEVGTFFKPNGKGLVIGSVKHDLWKSAVEMRAKFGRVKELKVYCGATYSRMGNEPHGAISGETVSSAPILVGWYDSWQNGMNEFAEVNLQFQPKRKSVTSHVPIGWNSWGSVQSDLDFETAVGISDYVKENLQDVWQKNEELCLYQSGFLLG